MQADARRDCAGLCFGSIIEGGSPIIGTTQRTVRQTWHSISSRSLTRTPPPKRWSPTHRRARMLSAKPVRLWAASYTRTLRALGRKSNARSLLHLCGREAYIGPERRSSAMADILEQQTAPAAI